MSGSPGCRGGPGTPRGGSPRAASGDPERLVLLESLLRQFEHDADEDDGAGDEDEDEGAAG
ncbi:MAG TPA: hypothetical protein VHB02_14100 [Acidimicrobiales bacterium]|nr:hypothetical protein [Acidimicrobiales bacterium]